MKRNILLFLFVSVIIFFTVGANSSYGFGVNPLSYNFEMSPGESREFNLTLLPGERQENILLNLHFPRQNLNGSVSYVDEETAQNEVAEWINIPGSVRVPPGEQVRVTGTVNVPFGAAGSHTAVIMVEQDIEDQPGLQVRFRYAVNIHIDIPQPWLRESMNVIDFSLGPDSRERPELVAHIENPSDLSYGAYGEVTIRDENRRLVERVVLGTAMGRQGTRIYPGAEVQFKNTVSAPLLAGDYDLRLFMRYGDGRQLIQSQQITLGDEFVRPDTLRYLEINPQSISSTVRLGGADTNPIQLQNRTGETLYYSVEQQEIALGYDHSIFENLEMQLMGSGRNTLSPRGQDRLMAFIRSSREEEEGGYYGNLELTVYSETGEVLETHIIEMEALVGEEEIYSVNLRDLQAHSDEAGTIISLSLQNSGNLAFSPRSTAYIYENEEEDAEILKTVRLNLPEDMRRVLPSLSGFMTGTVEDLESGEYPVRVRTEYGGEILAEETFTVEISNEIEVESGGN